MKFLQTFIGVVFVSSIISIHGKEYPSNCYDLEDGVYLMQLVDDDSYPLVNIKCSNGFAILDYNFDNNLVKYFTSWDYWHRATVGPSSNEIRNWREWYIPDGGNSESSHNYLVSPDCESCEYVANRQLYGDETTYWMTGTFFGCYWRVKANSNCDMDYETLDCYTCQTDDRYINDITSASIVTKIDDNSNNEDYQYTGLCTHNVRPANYYTPESQEKCTTSRTDKLRESQNLKPSLGTNGQYCVCTQPKAVPYTQYFSVGDDSSAEEEEENTDGENTEAKKKSGLKTTKKSPSQQKTATTTHPYLYASIDEMAQHIEHDNLHKTFMGKKISEIEIEEENDDDDDSDDDGDDERENVVELWQSDFSQGTYRMRESNTKYIIMEDIIFDFNPGNQEPSDLWSYWPLDSQYGAYPGARDYRDEYSFGFFAGIAIECDSVTIDLNGNALSMSKFFYLQQPWFTIIELSQQYFLPGQSFGFFGADPHFGSKIVIKNGVLGLTSHHGIHGNSNSDVLIKDLTIRDFNTHGIQLNGFTNVLISNVDVGPNSHEAYLNGQWGIARVLRRRWQHIADETVGETVTFNRKPKTYNTQTKENENTSGQENEKKQEQKKQNNAEAKQSQQQHENEDGKNTANHEPPTSMQDIVNDLSEIMEFTWDYVVSSYGITNNAKSRKLSRFEGLEELSSVEDPGDEKSDSELGPAPDDSYAKYDNDNNDNDNKRVKGDFNFDLNSIDEELFDEASDLFINSNGIPNAASVHGIFLNKFGASVFTYNLYSKDHSSTVKLENVNVHGLRHEMDEWSYLIATTLSTNHGSLNTTTLATDEIKNPFFGPIEANGLFYDFPNFQGYPSYKGNILIDGYIASTKLLQTSSNSFKYLGQQCVLNDILVDWATIDNDDDNSGSDSDSDSLDKRKHTVLNTLGNKIRIGCNMDMMNHAGKGTSGIRIDSVDDVILKNINIYDNYDSTPLGSTACGDYSTSSKNKVGFETEKTGHFRQTEPMQVGFSGNMNQGIVITASNNIIFQGEINVFDLTSETGSVFGIAIWPNNKNIIFDHGVKVSINNLEAGGSIDVKKYTYNDRPNKAPEVCGMLYYENYQTFSSSMTVENSAEINFGQCLAGDVGCMGSESLFLYNSELNNVEQFDNRVNTQLDYNGDDSSCSYKFDNSFDRSYTKIVADADDSVSSIAIAIVNANDDSDTEENDDDDGADNTEFFVEFSNFKVTRKSLNEFLLVCVVMTALGLGCIMRRSCKEHKKRFDDIYSKSMYGTTTTIGKTERFGGVTVEPATDYSSSSSSNDINDSDNNDTDSDSMLEEEEEAGYSLI